MSGFDTQLNNRIIVLKKIVRAGPVKWREIIDGTERLTGSAKISQSALDWLLNGGYIQRLSRGVYEATEKGEKLYSLDKGAGDGVDRPSPGGPSRLVFFQPLETDPAPGEVI